MAVAQDSLHRVVIVGGGFGGLYAAKELDPAMFDVTLIDRRNFHLFQPLLYQVATGSLSPADIASPLRVVLSGKENTTVMMDEVTDIDPDNNLITLRKSKLPYDTLIIATGVSHHYFGNDHWAPHAPGLKTIEDALNIRQRIFLAFEAAERESDPKKRQAWLTFVIVGGGPTGVELAGALAELANYTLKRDFRHIDTRETRVILLEGMDRVLPPYPTDLSAQAKADLEKLGVHVQTGRMVTNIEEHTVTTKQGDRIDTIEARTILWAAGVKASPLGKVVAERTGAELDRAGRVIVNPDLSVADHPNIFVIGDLAHYAHRSERPLPGVGAWPMQQGSYIAKLVRAKQQCKTVEPFQYTDAGSLAVIGRNKAVADLKFTQMTGFPAWFIWIFIHIFYLVEFDNKLLVVTQWIWNYITRNQGARLITGKDALPPLQAVVGSTTDPQSKISDAREESVSLSS
ncbi:MAG: NAD(P)/FAD-dependent oxidoreductase [Cyanobacteria bacterium J06626_14]